MLYGNIIYNSFLILICIRFLFELVNKKIWNEFFFKCLTSHFLSTSIWKWLVVKILIYHIFVIVALKKSIRNMIIIKLYTQLTNLFQSYAITMFNKY
jgi:hypothetical protein